MWFRRAMRVAGGGHGALEVADEIRHGAVFRARDHAQGPPVMFARFQPDRLKEQGGGYVVSMRDERHAHPRTDRLIFPAQVTGMASGAEPENQCPRNGHAKRHGQDE